VTVFRFHSLCNRMVIRSLVSGVASRTVYWVECDVMLSLMLVVMVNSGWVNGLNR